MKHDPPVGSKTKANFKIGNGQNNQPDGGGGVFFEIACLHVVVRVQQWVCKYVVGLLVQVVNAIKPQTALVIKQTHTASGQAVQQSNCGSFGSK